MKIKTLVGTVFVFYLIPMSLGLQEAFAGTSPSFATVGTVTVNPTCGTTATGTLDYPALSVGSTTTDGDEQTILITNTGNRNVDVIVSATDWVDAATQLTTVMLASATHFSIVDNTAYASQTTMTTTPATVNVVLGLAAGASETMFHKVSIVLVAGQEAFQATAQQTETVAFDCPAPAEAAGPNGGGAGGTGTGPGGGAGGFG